MALPQWRSKLQRSVGKPSAPRNGAKVGTPGTTSGGQARWYRGNSSALARNRGQGRFLFAQVRERRLTEAPHGWRARAGRKALHLQARRVGGEWRTHAALGHSFSARPSVPAGRHARGHLPSVRAAVPGTFALHMRRHPSCAPRATAPLVRLARKVTQRASARGGETRR